MGWSNRTRHSIAGPSSASGHLPSTGDRAAWLTQVSPVAWQHMHLCGRHEFTKVPESMHMAATMQALAEAPVPQDLSLSAPK